MENNIENNTEKKDKDVIDLGLIAKRLWVKKKVFLIMWPIVAVLSVLWVIPQPRYYTCSVSLAPETVGNGTTGGLAGLASNFGIDIVGGGTDAIYPLLYPDLLESNEFIAKLVTAQVTTIDDNIHTDYYTYLKKYQKNNWLTAPFKKMSKSVGAIFAKPEPAGKPVKVNELNPFKLDKKDYELFEAIKQKISASVDKKTDVVTITVQDQDPLICATMADTTRQRLQEFIIEYRTRKARLDVQHYQQLADSAKVEYNKSIAKYSEYCDANQDVLLQTAISERDKLESDMQLKYNTYTALCTQLEMMKAKLQERTPAFTTLKATSVPVKPAGPKRMLFVAIMLIFSTFIAAIYILKQDISSAIAELK